jgi:hypothetical protein
MEQTEAYALEHLEHEKHLQDHGHLHNRHHHHHDHPEDETKKAPEEERKLIGSVSESSLWAHPPSYTHALILLDISATSSNGSGDDDSSTKGCGVLQYPLSVAFIIAQEFCERFAYYGMRTILSTYVCSDLLCSCASVVPARFGAPLSLSLVT